MTGFFDRMLGRDNKPSSASTARDRLKMVLTYERIQITPEKMRELKDEMINLIARYIPGIDPTSVEVILEQDGRFNNRIVAEIPVSKHVHSTPEFEEDEELLDNYEFDLNNQETEPHSTQYDDDDTLDRQPSDPDTPLE